MILLGFPRTTIDIDLLVPLEKRSLWLDLMRDLGFRQLHGTESFVQFEPGAIGMVPVDLMFVDGPTWQNLDAEARQQTLAEQPVRMPRVEHLIALKLHAAASPARSAREQYWEDILQLVRSCHLDPAEAYFSGIILRYGGQDAMDRILRFWNES